MWLFSFVASVAVLFTWVIIFPQQAQALIAELKRRLRLWVIQQTGERAARSVARELYRKAVQAGYDPDLVKETLDEDWDIICERLGRPIAEVVPILEQVHLVLHHPCLVIFHSRHGFRKGFFDDDRTVTGLHHFLSKRYPQ